MPSNKYYDEWETPREAVLLQETTYLTVKPRYGGQPTVYSAPAGERVQILGRMTEDTREMYGGRWLYNASIREHGALVEEGVDFEFTS